MCLKKAVVCNWPWHNWDKTKLASEGKTHAYEKESNEGCCGIKEILRVKNKTYSEVQKTEYTENVGLKTCFSS